MTGPTIKNLVQVIQDIAITHPAVKSFGTGERHDISLAGNTRPVHIWLEQPFIFDFVLTQQRQAMHRYSLAILILDIPKYGTDNTPNGDELNIISRCAMLGDWLVLQLLEVPPTTLQIDGTPNIITLTEYGGDLWAGVRLEVSIVTPLPLGACDVRQFNAQEV